LPSIFIELGAELGTGVGRPAVDGAKMPPARSRRPARPTQGMDCGARERSGHPRL